MTGVINGTACFVAGTTVLTEDGEKPIEDIEIGDYVYASDPETGENGYKEVLQTFVNESSELVHIHINGDEIVSTPTHPFYSPVRGWTSAVDLRAGDILVLSNGEYVIVEQVQHEILEAPVKVYNFEVQDFHTYYVGKNSVLVHNRCGGRLGKKETREQNQMISEKLNEQGYTIIGGGGYPKGHKKYHKEEYLPGPGNSRKGSNYVDITAKKGDLTIRINTVDIYSNGNPTKRELDAAKLINSKLRVKNESDIILIAKGSGIGDLLEKLKIIEG